MLKTHVSLLAPQALYTVAEAARYLSRTEPAVRKLIHDHKLSVIRHGRRVHIRHAELVRYAEGDV